MATLKSPRWSDNQTLWSAESNTWDYGSSDADAYENIVFDRIIDPLHSIISDEFKVPVYYDEHKGNQSFMIAPVDNTLIEILSGNGAEEREHTIEISYQLKSGGQYGRNNLKKVSNVTEHLKRILQNNVNKTNAWFNGSCAGIEYGRDEDDPSILTSLITFEATTLEVFA